MSAELSRKSWTTAITFILLLLLFMAINYAMVRGFLLSVLMGGIIALLTRPLYRRIVDRHVKNRWAAAIVTLAVTVLIVGPMALFAYIAVKQAIALGTAIATDDQLSFERLRNQLTHWKPLQAVIGDPAQMQRQLSETVRSASRAVTGAILAVAGSLPQIGLQLALTLLSCYFLLVDGRKFVAWIDDKIPLDWDIRTQLYRSFQDTAVSVIWATLAAAAAQAALMFTGYLILGVPAAFLAAGATFVFAWVPVLGSTPVWLVGAGYLWYQGSPGRAIAMLVLGIFTSLVDNYVRPLVLKGRGDMHPLVSLVAIFGGIEMFGIMGVFVGPILAAILISLLQIWPVVGRRFGLTYEPRPGSALPTTTPGLVTGPIVTPAGESEKDRTAS
jgi:predicted PurR-regulated permease PerM